jgi:hypothetical protein
MHDGPSSAEWSTTCTSTTPEAPPFRGEPVYVQRQELGDARNQNGYTIPEWVDPPGIHCVPVNGEFELLPGLRLLQAPGHTRATMSRRCAGSSTWSSDAARGQDRGNGDDRTDLRRPHGSALSIEDLRVMVKAIAGQRVTKQVAAGHLSLAAHAKCGTNT